MRNRTAIAPAVALIAGIALVSCSAARPVLYPNDLYQSMGDAAAEEDVNHCVELAEAHDLPTDKQPEDAAKGAAAGGVVGALVGGAIGAVLGNPGRGAAAGAAGGGTRGGIGGIRKSGDGDPVYRRFIETCLHDKGYRVIGWK
jgi:uncharacterized protein YcfJ